MDVRQRKLEWISLVYLLFFVIAVLSPSLITHDYFGFQQQHIEEILIFLTGLASLLTFSIYERLMEKRTRERDEATKSAERATKELVESYKYIGSVNRQMEMLKSLANETSLHLVKSDAYLKKLLQSLSANAASCVNSPQVLLRFVELEKLRTERETFYSLHHQKSLNFSNKHLQKLHEHGAAHAFMRTDDGKDVLVVPSDKKETLQKAHLIIVVDPAAITEMDISLLKVFANQAELIYHHLIRREKEEPTPLEMVDTVTSQVLGEVK